MNDDSLPSNSEDVAALQQRIIDLEHELASLREQSNANTAEPAQLPSQSRMFEALVENAHDGIAVADERGNITYANDAWERMSGYGSGSRGMSLMDIIVPEDHPRILDGMQRVGVDGVWEGRLTYRRHDGSTFVGQIVAFMIEGDDQNPGGAAAFIRDITTQIQSEDERESLQQQMITVQQEMLRELATPLIPVATGVIVLPLVGAMNGERTQQVMETLLEGISSYQAEFAILDITGVRVVDTYVAQGLLRAAQAAKLLGTRVIVTGISSEVAQILVHLGTNLGDLITRSDLQSAIAYALHKD